jgi:hypothetical protein
MHLTDHLTDAQLNEYLDEAASERAQIEAHLISCGECSARLTDLQALFAELESLPDLALTRSLAAPFISPRSLPVQLPAWFPLTVTLQAAVALAALVIAVPFAIRLLPVPAAPSLGRVFIQMQTQWTAWLDMLPAASQFKMPVLPSLSFELSSLFLMSALAVVSMLWLVGNGLLLRDQIK